MTDTKSDAILDRMMALHPKVMDLVLDRVWRLLAALDNPQDRLPPVIHIAGTNGKGSTLAMIRAGLTGAGHTAHAYTSPHLAMFHERIRLAGTLISEDALTDLLDHCYDANGGDAITYFEITTCAAIKAFADTPADYTLLEVGLGGRLDATNVVSSPAATVITPVDLDHQQFLGDTLTAIAGEKAGILKRGAPAIIGPQQDEAMDVIEAQIARVGADPWIYGQHWHVGTEHGRLVYHDDTGLLDLPLPALRGPHQIQNAGTAIATLRKLGMGDTAFTVAMEQSHWPARMQRLPLDGEVWLDGGHNPAAGRAIASTLANLPDRPTVAICGMLNTKDITGILTPVVGHLDQVFTVTIPGEENAVAASDIAQAASDLGLNAQACADFETAFAKAQATGHRVLICGSLYLAGHVLRHFGLQDTAA